MPQGTQLGGGGAKARDGAVEPFCPPACSHLSPGPSAAGGALGDRRHRAGPSPHHASSTAARTRTEPLPFGALASIRKGVDETPLGPLQRWHIICPPVGLLYTRPWAGKAGLWPCRGPARRGRPRVKRGREHIRGSGASRCQSPPAITESTVKPAGGQKRGRRCG